MDQTFQNSSLFTFNKVKDASGRALNSGEVASGMPAQEKRSVLQEH